MRYILWSLLLVFVSLPLVTYLVYHFRRLGTRRKLLLQTILSLGLDDAYMRMRHGQKYEAWRKSRPPAKRIDDFENFYFNEDFRAGSSHKDYLWPIALFMIVTGVGWFLTLHRIYPSLTALADVQGFLPDPFAYAFVGAFLASIFVIFEDYRLYNLEPDVYYSTTYRILFSTVAAFTIGRIFDSAYTPLAAFGIGLFPIQTTWDFITEKTAQKVGAARPEGEFGLELAKIQGLEHQRNRQELIDANVSTIQALATSDPMLLFFNTTFPLRTIIDLIDKATLYMYVGDKVTELRKHGINGVIELVAMAQLANKSPAFENQYNQAEPEPINALFEGINMNKLISDLASVVGQTDDELKAFIYNLYYDPLVSFIYDIWGRCLNLDHRLHVEDEMEMNGNQAAMMTSGGSNITRHRNVPALNTPGSMFASNM